MKKNPQMEKILTTKEMFTGALIRVSHWRVELSDGKSALREIVHHKGAAAIVPVDAAGNVTLVRQYRVAMGREMLEIPAGKKDTEGEDTLLCAQRELAEETGLRAENWIHLTTIDTSPGFLTERIGLYLATGLSQGETNPDEDENLDILTMPLDEAVQKIMAGEITDAKTIAGLLMAKRALEQGGHHA